MPKRTESILPRLNMDASVPKMALPHAEFRTLKFSDHEAAAQAMNEAVEMHWVPKFYNVQGTDGITGWHYVTFRRRTAKLREQYEGMVQAILRGDYDGLPAGELEAMKARVERVTNYLMTPEPRS